MKFRNLNRYRVGGTQSKPQLAIPLPKTPDGRVYRYSPNEEAHPRHFVLGGVAGVEITPEATARMKLAPRSEQTVCPYSGVIAEDDAFMHPDDRDAAIAIVQHAAAADMSEAFSHMLDGVARRSGGMFKVERTRSAPRPKPRFGRRDLMRELVCDHCGRDYGVYAIALFCPDCGAPNLRLHFVRETELVSAPIALAEELPKEQHELAYRLIGNAHEDVLTAFETTLKTVYHYGIGQRPADALPVKPVLNDFQNVGRARERFAELDIDPFAELEEEALSALKLNVQKRHIIGHNLGLVDAKFAQHAEDARVGETVHIIGEDVRIFAGLCLAVVDRLDAYLAGGVSAPAALGSPAPAVPETPPMTANLNHVQVGELAKRIGIWLSTNLAEGRATVIRPHALTEAFTDAETRDLQDALAELAADGFITTTYVAGPSLPRVSVTLELFAAFDPVTTGNDPATDAAELAGMALEIGDAVAAKALHEKSGWPLRRFNPALGLLVAEIGDNRVSKSYDETYAVWHFHLAADDRLALKRYIERLQR